jgi:hypothetical protein
LETCCGSSSVAGTHHTRCGKLQATASSSIRVRPAGGRAGLQQLVRPSCRAADAGKKSQQVGTGALFHDRTRRARCRRPRDCAADKMAEKHYITACIRDSKASHTAAHYI